MPKKSDFAGIIPGALLFGGLTGHLTSEALLTIGAVIIGGALGWYVKKGLFEGGFFLP